MVSLNLVYLFPIMNIESSAKDVSLLKFLASKQAVYYSNQQKYQGRVDLIASLPARNAQVPYYGKLIGKLVEYAHGITGTAYAVDESTIFIKNFSYDGTGPDAFFWVGNTPRPSPEGYIIPYPEDYKGSITLLTCGASPAPGHLCTAPIATFTLLEYPPYLRGKSSAWPPLRCFNCYIHTTRILSLLAGQVQHLATSALLQLLHSTLIDE
uniref:DM13 domain-containing protein n=1 Tax=Timema cristinae TaxID=61476 RepID=A0A7R9CEL9_TIMCR|nr:unnamed protein product [Timema cristinae]